MTDAEARVDCLTKRIEELAPQWSMTPFVEAVQAMRGVAFIVAVTVVAEVGDFSRFDNPRQLMAFLGRVPSEHSSGATIRRGGITKVGNALARRALIEGHGPVACKLASVASSMTVTSACLKLSAISLEGPRSGCAPAIAACRRPANPR
ncbi:transposase [Bradyrhizobium sp. LB7.1]